MIEIRRAVKNDAQAIATVVKESILSTFPEVYPEDHINHTIWMYRTEAVETFIDERDFFIAVEDEQIVGSVCLKEKNHFMTGLYVHPSYMRKGIGKLLVEYIESFAIQAGYDDITLWSTVIAADFYDNLGYMKVRDIVEDGYVKYVEMKKDL